MRTTLIIDNYDSFTFNLYQQVARLSQIDSIAVRNNTISIEQIKALDIACILISPGPGRPDREEDFGVCRDILLELDLPMLGVCLGHQGLCYLYGGRLIYAQEPMHGQLSTIVHTNDRLFQGIPQHFAAMRYHSLAIDKELPAHLEAIAWSDDGELMAVRHRYRPFWGIQFHPESIGTEAGDRLIQNFLALSADSADSIETPKRRCQPLGPSRETATAPSPFQIDWRKLPVYAEPEAVFVHLYRKRSTVFWLDSSQTQSEHRFSFMGDTEGPNSYSVRYQMSAQRLMFERGGCSCSRSGGIWEYLNAQLEAHSVTATGLPFDFNGGFIGYFGYELKAECGGRRAYVSDLPDAAFIFADRLIAFNHTACSIYLIALSRPEQKADSIAWFDSIEKALTTLPPLPSCATDAAEIAASSFQLVRSDKEYRSDIGRCQHAIREGDTYQVCLTNQMVSPYILADPLTVYRRLRRINPAPYAAYVRFNEIALLCSSPERLARIDSRRWMTSKPIKGTCARSSDTQEDQRAQHALQHSEKERSENLMIVDLLRNDLGRICEIGTVTVPGLLKIESYATVHQLVSTIKGRLRETVSSVEAVRAVFPSGSMTGTPKRRTLAIIDQIETRARGIYSGALGFFALNNTADFNVIIRSLVITPQGTTIGIGSAIVALSDPEQEFAETLLKAEALLQALGKRPVS